MGGSVYQKVFLPQKSSVGLFMNVYMCVCMHKHAHVESMGVSCLPDDSLPYVVSQVFVVGLA